MYEELAPETAVTTPTSAGFAPEHRCPGGGAGLAGLSGRPPSLGRGARTRDRQGMGGAVLAAAASASSAITR